MLNRISRLILVYRIEKILARNNSRKPRGAARLLSPENNSDPYRSFCDPLGPILNRYRSVFYPRVPIRHPYVAESDPYHEFLPSRRRTAKIRCVRGEVDCSTDPADLSLNLAEPSVNPIDPSLN